jgi:cell wall-associated NlpC family hydrolase
MSIARRAAFPAALCTAIAVLAVALAAALPGARAWAGAPGGVSAHSSRSTAVPTSPTASSAPGRALLLGGRAVAPLDAPAAVKHVIAAANRIRTRPYVWGGGHGRWWDRGYDCSGAVSYALHGGELLDSPLPSGPMTHWGSPGPGRWITVYANAGHAFAVIAGLRWDTAGNTSGTGPRWHAEMTDGRGFVARHPVGY